MFDRKRDRLYKDIETVLINEGVDIDNEDVVKATSDLADAAMWTLRDDYKKGDDS